MVQKISVVKHFHRLNDVDLYDMRFLRLGLVIRGIMKMHPATMKKNLNQFNLKLMKILFEQEGLSVMWCIVVLCYVFLLRIHEIAGKTSKSHNFYCIRLGDLCLLTKKLQVKLASRIIFIAFLWETCHH